MRTGAVLALLLPAILAGCLSGGEPARPATGQIDGAVVDQVLRPFGNQTVYLAQLGWTDQTSSLGGFTFRDVPVGSYTVLAARDGTQGAAATVTVTEGRITKTILQLLPTPVQDPHVAVLSPNRAQEDVPQRGMECLSCAWTVPLDAERPAEVVFEAHWAKSALVEGGDGMVFQIMDDKGDLLWYRSTPMAPPFTATIDGADIPADARELQVQVWFGRDFTPRLDFHMESYMTFYYGATRAELFE